MQFEVFKSDHNQQWYWRIVAANGQKVAQSEGYHNKQDALATIRSVRSGAGTSGIYDHSTGTWI